ncbi:MAG: hypothetical protein WDN24_09610 [Sphingomonas sp.]
MTFGFATLVDLLSWTAAVLVGIKAAATVVLLGRDRATWFGGSGAWLWWSTKITPFLAVPCLIAIALIENRQGDFWVWSALMLFVVIAVPLVVWNRFYRKPRARQSG